MEIFNLIKFHKFAASPFNHEKGTIRAYKENISLAHSLHGCYSHRSFDVWFEIQSGYRIEVFIEGKGIEPCDAIFHIVFGTSSTEEHFWV